MEKSYPQPALLFKRLALESLIEDPHLRITRR